MWQLACGTTLRLLIGLRLTGKLSAYKCMPWNVPEFQHLLLFLSFFLPRPLTGQLGLTLTHIWDCSPASSPRSPALGKPKGPKPFTQRPRQCNSPKSLQLTVTTQPFSRSQSALRLGQTSKMRLGQYGSPHHIHTDH